MPGDLACTTPSLVSRIPGSWRRRPLILPFFSQRRQAGDKGGRVLLLLCAHASAPLKPVGQIRVHLRPITQIVWDGRVHLIQRQGWETLGDGLRGLLAVHVLVQNRFDSDPRSLQPDVVRRQLVEVVL